MFGCARGAHAQRRPQWHSRRLAAARSSSTGAPREGRSVATSRCFIWRSLAETLRSNSTGSAASGWLGRGSRALATTARVSSARAAASRSLKKRWHPRQSTCAEPSSYPAPPTLSSDAMKMPLPAASTTSCAHDAHRPPCASSSAPIRAVHVAAASGAPFPYRGRLVRAAASAPICTSFAAGSSRRRLHARAERHASHAAEWKVSRVLAVSLQQTPVFSAVRGAPQSAHGLPVPSGSTPPAAATSAIRRARFASAMCGPSGFFLSLT